MHTATHGLLAHSGPPPVSNRTFGFILTVWFLVFGMWPVLRSGEPRWWAAGIAVGCAVAAFALPGLFALPNRALRRFAGYAGLALQTAVTALLFVFVFVPMGLWMRRELRQRMGFAFDSNATSYWQPRERPAIAPDMRRQF